MPRGVPEAQQGGFHVYSPRLRHQVADALPVFPWLVDNPLRLTLRFRNACLYALHNTKKKRFFISRLDHVHCLPLEGKYWEKEGLGEEVAGD